MNRVSFIASLTAAICLGAVGGWHGRGILDPGSSPALASTSGTTAKPIPVPNLKDAKETPKQEQKNPVDPDAPRPISDLLTALEDGTITAEFRGNARDLLRATITNRSAQPLRLSLPAGQAFESAEGTVILPRATMFDFNPGEARLESLATLAVASTNRVGESTFKAVSAPQPKLAPLLEYLAEHPEISTPSAQTAALAILENLPASAFAKFSEIGSDLPTAFDTHAFRVETADIIQALMVLRQMGLPEDQLAITIDPQTKIEAMIDPLAHALAMQYYGIPPEEEWAFWKKELLEGNPSTRHYALHGIARYFPDVALPMLPRWAREPRTDKVLRLVSIRALAETQRLEALSILKGLEHELGPGTEFGNAAREAATYLETVLNKTASDTRPVLFRVNKTPELN